MCISVLQGASDCSSRRATARRGASSLPGSTILVITAFLWVASRANLLYLAAHTHSRAVVCLHTAHNTGLMGVLDRLVTHGNAFLFDHKTTSPGSAYAASRATARGRPRDCCGIASSSSHVLSIADAAVPTAAAGGGVAVRAWKKHKVLPAPSRSPDTPLLR